MVPSPNTAMRMVFPFMPQLQTLTRSYYNSMSQGFACRSLNSTIQIRNNFPLLGAERVTILSIGIIAVLVSVFNITALLSIRPLKQPPSDLLFVINIIALVKLAIVFATMIYDDVHPFTDSLPASYSAFCSVTGFMDILCELAQLLYVVSFSIYYIRRIRNPLKGWKRRSKEVNFLYAIAIILVTVILYFSGAIGSSVFGYCSWKFSEVGNYIKAVLGVLYTAAMVVCASVFLNYIRKITKEHKTIHEFFRYYCVFIVLFCLDQFVLCACELAIAIACTMQDNRHLFEVTRIIAHSCMSFVPIFITIIILTNPQFRRVMIVKAVAGLYERYKKWLNQRKENQDLRPSFYDELMTTNRKSILIELTNLALLDKGYLTDMKQQTKKCLLSSLLGCLSILHYQLDNHIPNQLRRVRTSVVEQDEGGLFQWNYTQSYTFTLSSEMVEHYSHIFPDQFPIVAVKFTAYAPNVLSAFSVDCNAPHLIAQRLSPALNQKQIEGITDGAGDGGKSGQFFFFTKDRSLILKSISRKQKQVFLSRLSQFHIHYERHPSSLIVRLCSIVTATNVETQEELHFMVMGSVTKCLPKKYIVRVYDLKGSQLNRKVLKDKQDLEESEESKRTLKDKDFQQLEQKVWLNQQDRTKIKAIIRQDSAFLCKSGLMDYSLLVVKVNWRSIKQDGLTFPCYRSDKEPGVGYVFGIIDYLQTWNLKKKGEKWYKSLFNSSNDISSQDPTFYSQRFIDFAVDILTP